MIYRAHLNNTGFGNTTQSIATVLEAIDLEGCLWPIGDDSSDELKARFSKLLSRPRVGPSIVHCAAPNYFRMPEAERPPILSTTFETDGLQPQEYQAISQAKVVIVNNHHCCSVLRELFPNKPIEIVQHGSKLFDKDDHLVRPPLSRQDIIEFWSQSLGIELSDQTLVYGMLGKYEVRKSHPEVIASVLQLDMHTLGIFGCYDLHTPGGYTFSDIHFHNYEPINIGRPAMLWKKGKAMILFLPFFPTKEQMHQVMLRTHIVIAPSKGEGWNQPLVEMMAYGMPCAATLNTGHLEYCDTGNVISISNGSLTPAYDGRWFNYDRGKWFDISSTSIGYALIRASMTATEELNEMGMRGRESVLRFTWEGAVRKYLEITSKYT